jgi:hypothetical protein
MCIIQVLAMKPINLWITATICTSKSLMLELCFDTVLQSLKVHNSSGFCEWHGFFAVKLCKFYRVCNFTTKTHFIFFVVSLDDKSVLRFNSWSRHLPPFFNLPYFQIIIIIIIIITIIIILCNADHQYKCISPAGILLCCQSGCAISSRINVWDVWC